MIIESRGLSAKVAVAVVTPLSGLLVPARWPRGLMTLVFYVLPMPAAVLGGYCVRAWRRRSAGAVVGQ